MTSSNALDALGYGIVHKNVNWVLDADIRGFFDAIPLRQRSCRLKLAA